MESNLNLHIKILSLDSFRSLSWSYAWILRIEKGEKKENTTEKNIAFLRFGESM